MEWRHRWRAMGVDCAVVTRTPSDPAWWEAQVEHYEQVFSRFRPDSELSRLNKTRSMAVSADLQELLLAAIAQAHVTHGLVVPHLGSTLVALGYDRTFAAVESAAASVDYPLLADWRAIVVRGRQVTLPPGAQLDLNGYAKGWIAQRLAERAGAAAVLVEIGGEVACIAPETDPWYVAVDHPSDPEPLALVAIAAGTVATSSVCERRWQRGGSVVHHIVDPRTGAPAQTDVRTATVITRDGIDAEVAAKVVLILGAAAGSRWLSERGLPGLLYTDAAQVVTTPAWAAYEWDAAR